MVRSPCCDNMGLKKGPWTPEEDRKLLAYIQEHGYGSWRALPSKAGLRRCGKSCRLRWTNYLRPDIKRGKFSLQEEQTIIQLHALLGNRWSAIATHLPRRTDNEIKNYWNTHLKKRLIKMGIDPITHKPKNLDLIGCGQSKDIANISHMAQWESARLQAEARLLRESKQVSSPYHPRPLTAAAPPPPPPLALLPRPPCLDILKVWEWTNPGKDISSMILNGYPPSDGDNMLPIPNVGLSDGNSSITVVESVKNSGASVAGKPSNNYHHNEAEGIMENSVELYHPIHDLSTYADDSLGFPSFIDGFTDLPPGVVSVAGSSSNAVGGCWGVLEESKINSWSKILNIPTSPLGSSML